MVRGRCILIPTYLHVCCTWSMVCIHKAHDCINDHSHTFVKCNYVQHFLSWCILSSSMQQTFKLANLSLVIQHIASLRDVGGWTISHSFRGSVECLVFLLLVWFFLFLFAITASGPPTTCVFYANRCQGWRAQCVLFIWPHNIRVDR